MVSSSSAASREMDPMADVEAAEPSTPGSDGLEGPAGEKRPAENGDGGEHVGPARKKARGGSGAGGSMRRVAEIVLVLSAMVKMRGGRSPTAAEAAMMAEAQAKVAAMCEELAPKDIIPRDAIGPVIEDLGLNKARDQRLGFRPPKMSIAEKMLLTKRKMEESKAFAAHATAYSSQRQMSIGAVAESRGTSQTGRMLPSDKTNQAPISSGGFQPAPSLGQVSTGMSTSLPHPLPLNGVKPSTVSTGLPSSHLGKDSSSLALPKTERTHFRLDGGFNGSSYAVQVRANPSNDQSPAKAPMWSLQPQYAPSVKSGPENKVPDHISAKVEGSADRTASRVGPQGLRDPSSRTSIGQATDGSLPHQPLQGINYAHASSLLNNHGEIAKTVQKLLQPQLPQHPTWTPPSRDYMNKALTCQICKITINEVESALVCDACEKGFHLKCVQASNQKGIPRGEWHCSKCLMLSNGKPLPPKYGRVMRNITTTKVLTNSTGVQSPSEKKMIPSDQKVNQLSITENGNSILQGSLAGSIGINSLDLASDKKIPNAREMQGNSVLSDRQKMNDRPGSEAYSNNSMNTVGVACMSSTATSNERSAQYIQASESSACEQRSDFESNSQPPVKLSDTVINTLYHSQASCYAYDVEQKELQTSAEVPLEQSHGNNSLGKDLDKSHVGETIDCKTMNGKDFVQASPVGTLESGNGRRECARFSSDGLYSVDWIGNIIKVVDEKTFYQSCCINGVTYKLHDHALFRCSNDKLIPSKLQAMWEDCKSRSKWIISNRCYFPGDLPGGVGRPCPPESNEVYASNHESTVMAGLIQGPCEVLPADKYKEELGRRVSLGTEATDRLPPVFVCKWLYDEFRGLFQLVTS